MLIDLHTHSRASDGTDTPGEVMHAAARAAVDVIALTDHDSTAGWAEAAEVVAATGVALVRGTEVSTESGGTSVHLLSYLHDPAAPDLKAMFDRSRSSRENRAFEMVERIGADMDLSWDDVQAHAAEGATIGRPHIADALVARGHATHRSAAFETILHGASPYYVKYWAPPTIDAIAAVLAAGGVPVMAHALASSRGRIISLEDIRGCVEAGLMGVEVDHPDHSPADREILRDLAAECGLLVTGSSDYHGTGKPTRLAAYTTTPEVLAEIEARGALAVLRP